MTRSLLAPLFTLLLAAGIVSAAADDTPATQPAGDRIVYVTKSGTKYHNATCRYASNAGVKTMTLSQAKAKGLSPCAKCGG